MCYTARYAGDSRPCTAQRKLAPKLMITIGQLARFAGVTIKAVRHYHKLVLLPEPCRDSSGYRRYSSRHAIDLVKIKTLAGAGVPLARIKELADKREAMGDPEFRALYLEYDSAFDWSPDDPRLESLADRTRRWLANRHGSAGGGERLAPAIVQLVATSIRGLSPAWDRLAEIARERKSGD